MLKVPSGESKRLAKIIYQNAKLINARIGDIMFHQSSRDGQQDSLPNLTVCSLVEVVQDTISLLQNESLAQQLNLIYSGPIIKKAIMIKTDPQKVQQILINLLTNAFKFSSPGGKITVKLKYTAGLALDNFIEVADEGLGIRQGEMKDLFTPYFQSHDQRSL